jgi:two-component system, cell cycle response regulator
VPTCLIVDDSLTIRRGLRLSLERLGLFDAFIEAKDGAEALEVAMPGGAVFSGPEVDVVLCDLVMPGIDGFAFLERFKQSPKYADVPVIVLTGQDAVDKKVRALEAGASDYLTKPFEPAELGARVKVHLHIKKLQDDLRAANDRLHQLAITDPLTGLYNRRHYMELMETELDRSRRHQNLLSILMVDVDHFKAINDTHGHQVGDKVLEAIASALQDSLRRHDVIARCGGEEFVVMLPQTGRVEAAAVGEKLRERIGALDLPEADHVPLSVSVGVACYPDQGVDAVDDLLKYADQALYRAKELGRDRVVMWLGEMQAAAAVAVQG